MELTYSILPDQRWKDTKDYNLLRDLFEIFLSVTPSVSCTLGVPLAKITMKTIHETCASLSVKQLQQQPCLMLQDLSLTIDHLAPLIVPYNLNPVLSVEI